MGKLLFSILGIDFKVSTILKLIAGGVVLYGLYWLYSLVDAHFEGIRELKNENTQLEEEVKELEGALALAVRINQENARTRRLQDRQRESARRIGEEERQRSNRRNTTHREISNEIDNTPETDTPVDCVIHNTLDSLWGEREGGRVDASSDCEDGVRSPGT